MQCVCLFCFTIAFLTEKRGGFFFFFFQSGDHGDGKNGQVSAFRGAVIRGVVGSLHAAKRQCTFFSLFSLFFRL